MCEYLNKNKNIIVSIVHFFISFLWEKAIFVDYNDFMKTIVRNNTIISNDGERLLVYAISRIFCFIIIWYGWKLVFYLDQTKYVKSNKVIICVYVIVLLVGIIQFPDIFGIEIDNYLNYSYAIRLLPTYWQGIYTGTIYAGCLMAIPSPLSIFVFQWTFFCYVIGYMCYHIKKLTNSSFSSLPLIIFALPESYYLAFNAYRNCIYTIFVIYYLSFLFFSIKEELNPTYLSIVKFSIVSSFIMVWRSEGLILGLGGLIIYSIYVLKVSSTNIKKSIIAYSSLVLFFLCLNRFQTLGNEKYYGQDYMIINTTNVLMSILNNPDANLAYPEAETDLKAINNVIPIDIIKKFGMRGYRDNNWNNGHLDFNQSLVSDEMASEYMRAYYRIIRNNMTSYLDVQINKFYTALDLGEFHETFSYVGKDSEELDHFIYDQWIEGYIEIRKSEIVKFWESNEIRQLLYEIINELLIMWREIIGTVLNKMIHSLVIVLNVIVIIWEGIKWFDKKNIERLCFVLFFSFLLIEMLAVFMFMPEGRATYMYPTLYGNYILLLFYYLSKKHVICTEKS